MKYIVVKTSQYIKYEGLRYSVMLATMDYNKAKSFADDKNKEAGNKSFQVFQLCKEFE